MATDSELLRSTLLQLSPLPPPLEDAFLAAWTRWELPRDHTILREHQVADYIWFIAAGSVRIFYRKAGREITEWLALDKEFFMSITSFFRRQPSRLIIHTLEPVVLYGIHHNQLYAMADEHQAIGSLLRSMITTSLILSQERMESIQFETAAQRYQRLLQRSPAIVQRIPGQYIASFLGITPETLSRIRQQRFRS